MWVLNLLEDIQFPVLKIPDFAYKFARPDTMLR